jgi:hypothetical protein
VSGDALFSKIITIMDNLENSAFQRFWNQLCRGLLFASFFVGFGLLATPAAKSQVSGGIFTTDFAGGTNINQFDSKNEVYLQGGPLHPGAAGLPDGYYHCQVTTPNGVVLGKSDPLNPPIHVTNGSFDQSYRLVVILNTASSGFTVAGYDDTTSSGGVYKVWVSTDSSFANSASKTDNFKVKNFDEGPPPNPTPTGELCIVKFYDANVNGKFDLGEKEIPGWLFSVDGIPSAPPNTPIQTLLLASPSCTILDVGIYSVTELDAVESHWIHTTPTVSSGIVLGADDHLTKEFGNVCIGPGGGKTLGFWSNKNGATVIAKGSGLAFLTGLNLVDGSGAPFDPGSYAAFRNWLLSGTAVNMSYMLSVQLATMELNVANGLVNGFGLVYAPQLIPFSGKPGLGGILGVDPAPDGFISVNALMDAANTELGLHGLVLSGNPYRAYQEALKDALDDANNNLNFVQSTPCPFSFVLP